MTIEQKRDIQNQVHNKELLEQQLWKKVLNRVVLPEDNFPTLVLILGPCRTATGALATTIGRAKPVKQVHIQALKAFGRKFVQAATGSELSTPLKFLKSQLVVSAGSHFEVEKETFGPDPTNPAEFINPLEIFLQKGYPSEKIIVVPTFREPLETASSWRRMWKWHLDSFPFGGFNRSFAVTNDIATRARNLNIRVMPYVHELSRDFGEAQVIGRMFKQMELAFEPSIVSWGDEDAYWTKAVKYDQPPKKWIEGSLGRASGGRGGFVWKSLNSHFTPIEEDAVLFQTKDSQQIYEAALKLARETLGF
jgi:hypothetical protein